MTTISNIFNRITELKSRTGKYSIGKDDLFDLFGDLTGRLKTLIYEQVTGVEAYESYSELPSAGVEKASYKVTNDTDLTLNGYYHWSDAAGDYVMDRVNGVPSLEETNGDGGVTIKLVEGTTIDKSDSKSIALQEDLTPLKEDITSAENARTVMAIRLDNLEYVHPEILSFKHYAGTLEVGEMLYHIAVGWTLNKVVEHIWLEYGDLSYTIEPDVTLHELDVAIESSTQLTLRVSDGTNTDQADLMVYFRHYMHWGVSADETLDSAGILLLSDRAFATTPSRTATFDCTGGKYIYFAFPKSFGKPTTIKVNGLAVSAWEISEVSHVNESSAVNSDSVAYDYYVYRSTNIQNSSAIAVEIIK